MKQTKILIYFCFICMTFFQGGVHAMVFPGIDWQVSTPEDQGIDSEKLENAMLYLENNTGSQGTSQAIVIVNGFIIWQGNDIDDDGDADGTDLTAMIKYFGQEDCPCFCPEDLNRDGTVDEFDLVELAEGFGGKGCQPLYMDSR